MQLELKRLQYETGITFVFVTHDQEEALTMSDRIGVMSDGKLLQVGPPREIYNRPANRFVADFIGETNFLTGKLIKDHVQLSSGELLAIDLTEDHDGEKTVTIAVRPEQVRILPDGPVAATVGQTVYFGTDTHCHARLADGTEIVVRLQNPPSGDVGLHAGSEIRVGFAEGALQVLEG